MPSESPLTAAAVQPQTPQQLTLINLPELYDLLYDHVDSTGWWPARSDWQIIWGAVLVQNTNWKNVDYALADLAAATAFLPERIRQLTTAQLQQTIRSAGFFVRKAQTIQNLCAYFAQYQDDLGQLRRLPPAQLRRELLALKGVGEETADTIMLYGLSQATFIVDVYARRLFQRLQAPLPRTYQAAQQLILPQLDPLTLRGLQAFHACIVLFGQQVKTEQAWQASFLSSYQLTPNSPKQSVSQPD